MDRPVLAHRSRRILYAVVTEYIATGEPVGSRTLSRRSGLELSPASIRNVLADLEEAGYLAQPHTSAGRVPTDLGFRVFIDALAQLREVSAEDRSSILSRMAQLRPGDDVAREAGKLLSSMTGAAAVVTPHRPDEDALAQIRFLPLGEEELLAVIVTRSGSVQNRIVRLGHPIASVELERVHNFLATIAPGRTLIELRSLLKERMDKERGDYALLQRQAREVVDAAMTGQESQSKVVIEGQGRLFDRPEFADPEKIRAFLRTFEETEHLVELLDRTLMSGGVQVLVGAEAKLGEVQDISLITAGYGPRGTTTGAVGVIGPSRMDYQKVVPLVGFTAQAMSDLLDTAGEPGPARPSTNDDE